MNDNQEIPECEWDQRQAKDRHEIFFGKHRKLSVKYELQIDLCQECHNAAHGKTTNTVSLQGKSQEEIAEIFCKQKNLDYSTVLYCLNNHKMNKECQKYLKTLVKIKKS